MLCTAPNMAEAQRAQALNLELHTVEMAKPTAEMSPAGALNDTWQLGARMSDVVFWSEDFSNQFEGQDVNNPWTFGGAQGDLWFITYAQGTVEGYDPLAPLSGGPAGYGDSLSNYFGNRVTVSSATPESGFAMLDADRWNSSRWQVSQELEPNTSSRALDAELISPVIDLSAAEGIGAEIVMDSYFRLCCSGVNAVFGVVLSFDGGNTWEDEDLLNLWPLFGGVVNADFNTTMAACISPLLLDQSDLSQFRFKFVWSGPQSHYFWMIDDIRIQTPPANDISIAETYLNHHERVWLDSTAVLDEDYYMSFEYERTPEYLVKPLEFGARVRNLCSQNTQTGVVVNMEVLNPDGSTQTVTTIPATVAPFAEALVYSEPTFLDAWNGNNAVGTYTVSYQADADEEDDNPSNNVGTPRTFIVTGETGGNADGAVVENGGTFLTNFSFYTADAITQNSILNAPYIFDDPLVANTVITHVEVVFLNYTTETVSAATTVGEAVYFNVRLGLVTNDNPPPSSNPTQVFFGSDNFNYSDVELEYIIEEDDLFTPGTDTALVYTSFELPSPVLIEPGNIYSAEMRYGPGPSGLGIVFVPMQTVRQERAGLWFRSFEAAQASGINANQWYTNGGMAAPAMRFRTSAALSVDKVTYDAGIKVTQNWPNPFVNESRFQFQLDESRQVRIEIRDLAGKLVHSDDLGMVAAGVARDYFIQRKGLASGVYVYSVITGEDVVTRKMVIE